MDYKIDYYYITPLSYYNITILLHYNIIMEFHYNITILLCNLIPSNKKTFKPEILYGQFESVLAFPRISKIT